jgi:hypothetical protein
MLLLAGASPVEETKNGNTPVHIAAMFGHWEILGEFAKCQNVNMRQVKQFLYLYLLLLSFVYNFHFCLTIKSGKI